MSDRSNLPQYDPLSAYLIGADEAVTPLEVFGGVAAVGGGIGALLGMLEVGHVRKSSGGERMISRRAFKGAIVGAAVSLIPISISSEKETTVADLKSHLDKVLFWKLDGENRETTIYLTGEKSSESGKVSNATLFVVGPSVAQEEVIRDKCRVSNSDGQPYDNSTGYHLHRLFTLYGVSASLQSEIVKAAGIDPVLVEHYVTATASASRNCMRMIRDSETVLNGNVSSRRHLFGLPDGSIRG